MRILALTWTTFDDEKRLMINERSDLICPAIDGITNELVKLGHQVVYVNLFPEQTKCLSHISGLAYHSWQDIKNKEFDVVWHAIKDPTPPQAIPCVNEFMQEFGTFPVWNDVKHLKDHNKRKYITLMREKNVGAIILDDYEMNINNCFPPSQGCYVSKDKHAIRLSLKNSQRTEQIFSEKGGITLKYHDTAKYPNARKGYRTFFRVPYAAGKCLKGYKYYCPEEILCPKSGAAVEREDFEIPDMTGGTIAASMQELGVDLAHIEGVEAGFTVEIFDVNPFPCSHGVTLRPMAERMAKRLIQVYDI